MPLPYHPRNIPCAAEHTQLPIIQQSKLNISASSTYTKTAALIPNSLQISHFIQNHLL